MFSHQFALILFGIETEDSIPKETDEVRTEKYRIAMKLKTNTLRIKIGRTESLQLNFSFS